MIIIKKIFITLFCLIISISTLSFIVSIQHKKNTGSIIKNDKTTITSSENNSIINSSEVKVNPYFYVGKVLCEYPLIKIDFELLANFYSNYGNNLGILANINASFHDFIYLRNDLYEISIGFYYSRTKVYYKFRMSYLETSENIYTDTISLLTYDDTTDNSYVFSLLSQLEPLYYDTIDMFESSSIVSNESFYINGFSGGYDESLIDFIKFYNVSR